MAAWLGFAVTFVARPFGGLVLGLLGDLFGRKVSTFLSIVGMMIGTVGQGVEGCTYAKYAMHMPETLALLLDSCHDVILSYCI